MPEIHPRYWIVSKAENELSVFILEWQQKHDLTFGETIKVLCTMIERESKYLIRSERHPEDPDKKGDEL